MYKPNPRGLHLNIGVVLYNAPSNSDGIPTKDFGVISGVSLISRAAVQPTLLPVLHSSGCTRGTGSFTGAWTSKPCRREYCVMSLPPTT